MARPARRSPLPPAARPSRAIAGALLLAAALLAGCGTSPSAPAGLAPAAARAAVVAVLPPALDDREGWAADVHAALTALSLPATPEHLCAVLAVTEQESGFRADPPVPGLGAIAWQEIERRADAAHVPMLVVRGALALKSSDGRSFADRIDSARTERQLSEVFDDFIGLVPFGRSFFGSRNPVRTAGPMQVSVAFAEALVEQRAYPYPLRGSVRDEAFTRRGGLYFGTAHLLAYTAPYERMLHRFADFNAGRWASRNAAFQSALAAASGQKVDLDGDLLPAGGPRGDEPAGQTERVARGLAPRLGLAAGDVRRDLLLGDGEGFTGSELHARVFALAERAGGRALPRALVPRIDLASPKFTRKLTTAWFADRVDQRHRRCLDRFPARPAGGRDGGRDDS